jgi:hypothetical protein
MAGFFWASAAVLSDDTKATRNMAIQKTPAAANSRPTNRLAFFLEG